MNRIGTPSSAPVTHPDPSDPPLLRRGWTTGACATAATKAALLRLWGGNWCETVTITLPRGETPTFDVIHRSAGDGWAEAGIVKDAGDDPDVTHGATIVVRVGPGFHGVTFRAGPGVGLVTRPGLPIPPGEPAINPVPRAMMDEVVAELASEFGRSPDVEITVSIPGGEEIARRTWNPRLGIEGGLSILGTTGIVRPFSCAAWIASIHRGIDVARASGVPHVAGCTGATSEATVRALHGLPEIAMIDMGDFAGGMLKYLRRHPIPRVTLGGGIGKIIKFAQGAQDLHSGRSQIDMARLAEWADDPRVAEAPTALAALTLVGPDLAARVAREALVRLDAMLDGAGIASDVVVIDRTGNIVGSAGP
ncbi:cobalt-precorrin-5B (C(1))-methyltransferase [Rubellimicrobium rubrum]|uniref:Cobalt-precorrin-5B C(1)-methyltransferase n=1 Tax=Rubellimicrobium rubrum TaxID=2585369 RepID=A0A5C4N0M1_9RHOB|nr:cobalt-precorrin-5B (C(1))-methyltransferase [Rubellimicrobium rubrum]TNC50451.1 cobalt-precorrin-5B (C(1))-methyltransferase [Rubellimicrobium rubrum]